jgi:hypothetical protein
MKHPQKARGSSFGSALLLGLAVLGSAQDARASQDFPPLLQQALEKQFNQSFCVPLCTACHLTTTGGPGNINPFGGNLEVLAGLRKMDGTTVGPAIQKWFGTPPPAGAPLNAMGEVDSDGDGIGDATELKDGDSPSLPGPRGVGQFCTDLRYGCAGGRIAAAPPPVDRAALLSAGLVVVGFAAMRRRRRLAKRAR